MAKGLGELLVKENLIDIKQLEAAKKVQKNGGGRLSSSLVKLGYISEGQLAEFLSKQYQIPSIDLSNFEIDADAIKLVPRKMCDKHIVIPVSKAGDTIVIAMSDPSNIYVLDDLAHVTRCKVKPVVASENAILKAIDRYYQSSVNYESIMTEIEKDHTVTNFDSEGTSIIDVDTKDDSPVVRFVNMMLTQAIKLGASDIHVEPYEKRFRVRFRIDGSLYEKVQPPAGIAAAISSRIKVMCNLDISEKRRPQDGRLKIQTSKGQEIDFRVSILPTLFGEKVVMRILDKSNLQLDLTKLGFDNQQLELFKDALAQPNGILLITGPTGSGKTTTIYSGLAELNKPDVNISTIEDPVEFNLEGINQVQANFEINLTFAAALRSFLRQDPDVIMVGEIRDLETAEIAFKAALTGHLVVSTLHTNDAPLTINRLLNMGVEPFLITSAVNLVIAQRLVRKICSNCKIPMTVEKAVLLDMGLSPEEAETVQPMKGEGCDVCNGIGYKGRLAVHEVMKLTDQLKIKVFQNASPLELKKAAIEGGMTTLRRSAINKMIAGVTTIEEVLGVTAADN